MDTFFEYLVKSTLWLFAFYVVFRFGLQKTTLHDFKRFFLLAGMAAALIMPFVIIYRTVPSHAAVGTVMAENGFATVIDTPTFFTWKNILLAIYAITAIILTSRYLIAIVKIINTIKHKETDYPQRNIILTNNSVAPFSFGKYIFIPQDITSPQELELILKHESIHTAERHYIDLWLSKLLCIIQFFNPLVWLYARAIQENCEYIADHKTLKNSDFKQEYLNLLIKYSIGQNYYPVSLHFAFPLIFNRIKIMKQEKSNKLTCLKSLLVLPLACLILVSYAQTKEVTQAPTPSKTKETVIVQKKQEQTKVQTTTADTEKKAPEKQAAEKASMKEVVVVGYRSTPTEAKEKDNDVVFAVVETMPQFPGGVDGLGKYLASSIKYPTEAQKKGIQGRVIAQFIVETDGSITSVNVVRGLDPLLDAEACRVLYNMPKWIPGQQRGQVVRVKYTIPIAFKLN